MQKMIYFHGIVQLGLLLKVSQFLAFEPFLDAVLDMIKIRVSFEFEENSRMFFFYHYYFTCTKQAVAKFKIN